MRFRGLDLNLLVAMESLLETRNTTRAAERMNLSQPAMSAALSRLREYFEDPLLVRDGKRMHPTAYADALLPQIKEALAGIEALIETPTKFEPETSRRTFRIAASDYLMVAVLTPVIAKLTESAPGIRIENVMQGDDTIAQVEQGKLDLLIAPEEFIGRNLPSELLFEEKHVVVGAKTNPRLTKGTITDEDFWRSSHVSVAFGRHPTVSFADRHLYEIAKQRQIDVTTASFTAVPWLLLNSNRLAVMHDRLARAMAQYLPLQVAALPFRFPTMREMMQFHEARREDAGLQWLRNELRLAASLP